jgi:hypothetical protein
MAKLDHNIDAYRLAATTLSRLRSFLRRHLEAAYGPSWEKDGLPAEPASFLAQRRERENAVKWNSSSGLDLLDFAGFVNLYEVLSTQPRLLEGFSRLVPEPQALRLRFLELDTVLNRVAYARPVSESDVELLLGFDERLRGLATELQADAATTAAPAAEANAASKSPREATAAVEVTVEPEPLPTPAAPPAAAAPPATGSATAKAAAPHPEPSSPPAASRQHVQEPRERSSRGQGSGHGTPPSGSIPIPAAKDAQEAALPKEFTAALRRGDDATVLAALYQEITGLAEKIWSDAASARSPVWEAVRESSWYANRFSALRLRVVSDFYDLMRAVQERVADGKTRTDLHEFLKERNFAQVLMDLREFFRPLVASGRHIQGPSS